MTDSKVPSFLFSFEGRISRKRYLLNFVLPVVGLSVIALVIDGVLSTPLMVVLNLALIWPGLATAVKRWHDRGKSGWMILINLLPLIGAIWSLVETWCLPGTPGPNRFGPDPLAESEPGSLAADALG